jgi:hypothetical protein
MAFLDKMKDNISKGIDTVSAKPAPSSCSSPSGTV